MFVLDTFSGIGGFAIGAEKLGWESIGFAEIDPYASKVLEKQFGGNNFHDVTQIALPESALGLEEYLDQDLVPSEMLGREFCTLEDLMEGVVEWPTVIVGGSPCQDISPASVNSDDGIDGAKSSLMYDLLDLVETLEPNYFALENSSNLLSRGLSFVVERLTALGYIVEWETISGAHFGFNHYRHRVYLVAYKSELGTGQRLFDIVASMACWEPDYRFPLKQDWTPEMLESVYVDPPKSIKNRTNRIKALGNAILPQVGHAVLSAIDTHSHAFKTGQAERFSPVALESFPKAIIKRQESNFSVLPSRGVATAEGIGQLERCERLNPTNRTYEGMLSTLLRVDGKNNFTTTSRLNRPGSLGGLTGTFMQMGVRKGGLCPSFAEAFMGYPVGHTAL